MMKIKVMAFVLAMSMVAFAQGRSGGSHPSGPPPSAGSSGMGAGASSESTGKPDFAGRPDSSTGRAADHMDHSSTTQQPLKDSQINGGSFKMLEKKTGMTESQLKDLYSSSGAKNYGQFVSAMVVSKNLGLDSAKVLAGLKDKSLGQTLQDLGIPKDKADAEIKKADAEIKSSKSS